MQTRYAADSKIARTFSRSGSKCCPTSVVGTLVVGAVAFGGWWFLSRKTAIASLADAFKAAVTAQPIPFKDRVEIAAARGAVYNVTPPGGKVPGRLYGRWTSKGVSAGIRGAKDDTLVGFKIVGPDNTLVEKLDHPTGGNFNIRFDTPGVYTFTFDNSGIIRSSARVVEIDGTYQPD